MSERRRQVAIVTDSTSSLTQAMGQERGIHVVPIHVSFGTQTYRDGIDLDADQFYRLLRILCGAIMAGRLKESDLSESVRNKLFL